MKWAIIKLVTFTLLVCALFMSIKRIQKLNDQLAISVNNEKAYAAQNSELYNKNLAFKMSMTQLMYYNDSLMMQMKRIANENGIKDRKIQSLQYQLETFTKRDTLIIRDTIFRDPAFRLDTCLRDQWNTTCLHLQYPGNISVESSYKNDKYIILNSKREPIKPRKWFLPRWFTRKHTVVEITVVDENPYVQTKKQTYIEILNNDN